MGHDDFEREVGRLANKPGEELAGLSLAVTTKDGPLYDGAWGRRFISSHSPSEDKPMLASTICRVASLSKPVCALVALVLEERGLIDLHRDLSPYLGFSLGNPHFPDQPITAAHIFTHTSSLRDGTPYNLPRGGHINTLVSGPEALPNWSRFHGPDRAFFSYSNLGYGVVATALERVTGRNYSDLAREIILNPLREALGPTYGPLSFSLADFTPSEIGNMATLYRKWDENNPEAESGDYPWTAQMDSPSLIRESLKRAAFAESYEPGTNGTLFSPQGGLRASVLSLTGLARLFLGRGTVNGKILVSPEIIEKMTTPFWRFDPVLHGERESERREPVLFRASGLGLFKITNDRDKWGSDSFLPGGGPECWGHHGDAYGLKGALFFDFQRDLGFSYLITGTSKDPELTRGTWSSYSRLEENLTALIVDKFWNRG